MEDPNAEQTPLGTLQKGSIDILGAKVINNTFDLISNGNPELQQISIRIFTR